MRFRLNNQDYIRLQTIAFFIPMLEAVLEKCKEEDSGLKITYFDSQITIYPREICAFKKLQQIFNDLTNVLFKNNVYDIPVQLGKQKTTAIELGKQIKVYLSLESAEETNELLQFINKKFYTISDAAQFITRFSDIVDCYKFSQLSQDVDFLKIVAEPILTFASYSPRNFPDDFITGIRECVAFLSNHGVDHTKWDSAELKKLIFSCLDVYNKAHKMLKGKCCSDEKAMQKEINRRKKISQKKLMNNEERRKDFDNIMRDIRKQSSLSQSDACRAYFYSHAAELKNKFGISSWRTLLNHWNQKDPNKARKINSAVLPTQFLAESKCKDILAD